jgi:hypothetical protein
MCTRWYSGKLPAAQPACQPAQRDTSPQASQLQRQLQHQPHTVRVVDSLLAPASPPPPPLPKRPSPPPSSTMASHKDMRRADLSACPLPTVDALSCRQAIAAAAASPRPSPRSRALTLCCSRPIHRAGQGQVGWRHVEYAAYWPCACSARPLTPVQAQWQARCPWPPYVSPSRLHPTSSADTSSRSSPGTSTPAVL